jgi:hypothetical protein
LQGRGLAIDRLASEGRYLFVDFAGGLSQAVDNGQLDEARFREGVAALLHDAWKTNQGARRRIALCGEGAPCLWQSGQSNAAICIERLWNELSKAATIDSLCAYDGAVLSGDDSRDTLQQICSEHAAVHFRRDVVA